MERIESEEIQQRDGLGTRTRLRGTRLRTEHPLAPIVALGRELSRSDLWTIPGVLEALGRGGIGLSELFDQVPDYLEIDGRLFRITLATDGRWPSSGPTPNPAVVLDPEIHADLQLPAQVLSFREGRSFYQPVDRVAGQPAIVLSLEEVAPDTRPEGSMTHYPSRLSLGAPRSLEKLARGPDLRTAVGANHTEVTPSCSFNRLVCPLGATAYFYLDALDIVEDQETLGSPEIELEVHRLDERAPGLVFFDPVFGVVAPGCGGGIFNCNHTGRLNRFIFDGGVHQDALGRSLTLPDVNNKLTWYTMSPVALFRVNGSFSRHAEVGSGGQVIGSFESTGVAGWSINLVDDDWDKGILHLDMRRVARTRLFHWPSGATAPAVQSLNDRFVDNFALWRLEPEPPDIFGNDPGISTTPYLHDYSSLDDSDDPYESSNNSGLMQGVGVSEALFTTAVCGAGKPAGTQFQLSGGEFFLKGHFGCAVPHVCGDGTCTSGAESCSTCSLDCGRCPDPGGGGSCIGFDYSQCEEMQSCQVFCEVGSSGTIGQSCCGCMCNGFSECPICLLPAEGTGLAGS